LTITDIDMKALPKVLTKLTRAQVMTTVVTEYRDAVNFELNRVNEEQISLVRECEQSYKEIRADLTDEAQVKFAKLIERQIKLFAAFGVEPKNLVGNVSVLEDGFSTHWLRRSHGTPWEIYEHNGTKVRSEVIRACAISVEIKMHRRDRGGYLADFRVPFKPKAPLLKRIQAMQSLARQFKINEDRLKFLRGEVKSKADMRARVETALTRKLLDGTEEGRHLIDAMRKLGMINGALSEQVREMTDLALKTTTEPK